MGMEGWRGREKERLVVVVVVVVVVAIVLFVLGASLSGWVLFLRAGPISSQKSTRKKYRKEEKINK